MESTHFDLAAIQAALQDASIDGWLFYDFRGSDPIARSVLGLDPHALTTRRWFYYVPATGAPRKLVHKIESGALESVPGDATVYLTWQSLAEGLRTILDGASRVAMQYSSYVPYVSRVDAGTVEAVRAAGVEVVTSADLVQTFHATLSEEQFASHLRAAERLRSLVDEVFDLVGTTLRAGKSLTEKDVFDFVHDEFRASGLVTDHAPIVGVNEHAADPHFEVAETGSAPIRPGDLLLFDVWAKEEAPGSIFADITWCAFLGDEPPAEMVKVAQIVRDARDAAIRRADEAFSSGQAICGYEVDRACREVIENAGYGEYFIHRTGHSIGEMTHGDGANIDDLETHDTRRLLPRTLFSIEPGIYLPGRFGIRSEVDVWHTGSSAEVTGPPHQTELTLIEV